MAERGNGCANVDYYRHLGYGYRYMASYLESYRMNAKILVDFLCQENIGLSCYDDRVILSDEFISFAWYYGASVVSVLSGLSRREKDSFSICDGAELSDVLEGIRRYRSVGA